jgi:hypothetical protein
MPVEYFMIDLSNQKERGRLFKAIKTSKEDLVPFLKVRSELIKDHRGSWYSEGAGARYKTLANLINQTAKIYIVCLASSNPKVMVTTPNPENWTFAKRFEVGLNKLISDMCLHQTFRAIVLDAFFCIGCGVVMMRDTDTRFHGLLESEEDVWFDPGEPWLNRVSIDNLILDMSAKEISKMRYCGHEYRADFDKMQAEPGYNKAVVKKLTPTSKTAKDDADISAGNTVDDDDLKPMIWLQDVWIPENKSIATFACNVDLPPLIEREWTGSQGGPYKFLSLGLTPDGIIPSSPASNLKGLHDLQNRLHRKMERQSDQQRTVNTYVPGSEDDVNRIVKSKADWVKVRDSKAIGQMTFGGVDAGNQAFSLAIQDEYDRFAGNLRAMGGLGQQATTLGQEELIQGNVSKMEADMRLAVVNFAAECCTDLAYLMWNDENLEINASIEAVPGIHVDSSWPLTDPETGERIRLGKFEDYDFHIEPFSMVYKNPSQKLQELFATLNQLAPLWPMFQASGASLDVKELVKQISDLQNRPELTRIITFASPAAELGGDQNTIRSSPVTSRETIRKNVPTGGTAESRSSILQQVLGGGKSQVNGAQAASLARSPA